MSNDHRVRTWEQGAGTRGDARGLKACLKETGRMGAQGMGIQQNKKERESTGPGERTPGRRNCAVKAGT